MFYNYIYMYIYLHFKSLLILDGGVNLELRLSIRHTAITFFKKVDIYSEYESLLKFYLSFKMLHI